MMNLPLSALLTTTTIALFSLPARSEELVLNGSFENSFVSGCNFSLTNAAFTAAFPNLVGFGVGNHLDVLQGVCFSGPAPSDGQFKVGLQYEAVHGTQDAFSFRLAAPVSAGASYRLSFTATSLLSAGVIQPGSVDIGVSSSPTTFGSPVYTGSTVYSTWTQHQLEFVAPMNAAYLTVRAATNIGAAFLQVDAFSLELVPSTGWIDLGSGLAGTNGTPLLFGSGTLLPGTSGSLTLVSARPNAPALLCLSPTSTPQPALGGLLVAHPIALAFSASTDPFGSIGLNWVLLPPAAAGQNLYCQWLIMDPMAPSGVAFSNALRGVFP